MFSLIEDLVASRHKNKELLFLSPFRFVTDSEIAEISPMKTIVEQHALLAHSDVVDAMLLTGQQFTSERPSLIRRSMNSQMKSSENGIAVPCQLLPLI